MRAERRIGRGTGERYGPGCAGPILRLPVIGAAGRMRERSAGSTGLFGGRGGNHGRNGRFPSGDGGRRGILLGQIAGRPQRPGNGLQN